MALLPEKYGCLYIDCTWRDILAGYRYIVANEDRKELQSKVEGLFGGSQQWLACLSVRSAFDLFLSIMRFPPGSEIIFTAINIPDMTEIAEYHGLTVIPVDIDVDTLAPKEELVELAVTDKTVAILAAHIYGKWTNLDSIFEIARLHGLFVLEDCAECFHGLKKKGDKKSDLTFFSFGSIKYITAIGGAIVKVKDSQIMAKMRAKFESYQYQTHWTYLKKLMKYSLIMMAMNSPTFGWVAINIFHFFRFEYKELFISLLRGFPGDLVRSLHYQPSAALLALMYRRLTNAREEDFELCKVKGDYVKDRLPDNVFLPGCKAEVGNYWLFPILVDNPAEVFKALEKEGIEPYIGCTQLQAVMRTSSIRSSNATANVPQQEKLPPTLRATACYDSASSGLALERGMLSAADIAAASGGGSWFANIPSIKTECKDEKQLSAKELNCSPLAGTDGNGTLTSNLCTTGDDGTNSSDILFPHNAKYLIDHVIYLPVHKRVPIWYLDYVCSAVERVMKNRIGVKLKSEKSKVLLRSKL